MRGHHRPGDLLEDLAELHRPQRQVARGEPAKNRLGSRSKPSQTAGISVAETRPSMRRTSSPWIAWKIAAATVRTTRNTHITPSRDRSASGMTWSTRMPEAIGIDRPSSAPRRP